MSYYSKLYNLVLLPTVVVASPIWLPVLLSKKKHRVNFWQRLGFLTKEQKRRLPDKPRIWFHAVSVGEFNLTLTLLNVLRPMLKDKYGFVETVAEY